MSLFLLPYAGIGYQIRNQEITGNATDKTITSNPFALTGLDINWNATKLLQLYMGSELEMHYEDEKIGLAGQFFLGSAVSF